MITALTEIQRSYFELLERHLTTGPLQHIWTALSRRFSENPEAYEPTDWAKLLENSAPLVTLGSSSNSGWVPSFRKHIDTLVSDVLDLWAKDGPRIQDFLSHSNSYSYYVPYNKLHKSRLIRNARIYFDTIFLEEPISQLECLLGYRDEPDPLISLSAYMQRRSVLNRGTNIQIASILYSTWWILRYRSIAEKDITPHEVIVIPSIKSLGPKSYPPARSEIASKIALAWISETTDVDMSTYLDLLSYASSHRLPWTGLATGNPVLSGLFSSGDHQPTVHSVVETIETLLGQSGFPLEALPSQTRAAQNDAYMAYGIYAWLQLQAANQLSALWNSSVVAADCALERCEWPFHQWIIHYLSNGNRPDDPASNSQIAALAIQSDKLVFFDNLTNEQISFVRRNEGLREIRGILGVEHTVCRREISRAPELAAAAADRFVSALDDYKARLEQALEMLSKSQVNRIVSKASTQKTELGLSVGIGAIGILVPPPWSILLASLGGGQSVRGLFHETNAETHEDQLLYENLTKSPLSACLQARGDIISHRRK